MNRTELINLANDTMNIINKGSYINNNETINIKNKIIASIKGTKLYKPEDKINFNINSYNTDIEITEETSLHATQRLISEGFKNVACLNFASAKHPCGGFLTGAMAQEESLAYSSALYPTIAQKTEMYKKGLADTSGYYNDYIIYSPSVPVFRDDSYNLLDSPYYTSFITSPAVNAGVVRRRQNKQNISEIHNVMLYRIQRILEIALANNIEAIVLGAFGCGVFQNNPNYVAEYFKTILQKEEFKNSFKKIIFAIYDPSTNKLNFKAFNNKFKDIKIIIDNCYSNEAERITKHNNYRIETMKKAIIAFDEDKKKDKRLQNNLCKNCFYTYNDLVTLQVITKGKCIICNNEISSCNSDIDKLCNICAKKYKYCKHCGAKLD